MVIATRRSDALTEVGQCILDLDLQALCVTWSEFKELLLKIPYGHPVRVMVLMLAYTGCRVSELDNMFMSNLSERTIRWRCGKNQKGSREETLPRTYFEELIHYRAHYRTDDQRVFGFSHITFSRRFNMARATIGGSWVEKGRGCTNGTKAYPHYRLQLRYFRKTFQTICFKHYYEKYNDASVALEWVSKRMRHSSEHLTAYHYIQNLDHLRVTEWLALFFNEKPSYEAQRRLTEFCS